jgi:hypothetical protein
MKPYTLLIGLAVASVLFFACQKRDKQPSKEDTEKLIEGSWVQSINTMPGQKEGFTLNKDHSAASINMHTLEIESWDIENGYLNLKTKSIGNGQTIDLIVSYKIDRLDKDSLILTENDNVVFALARQNNKD